MRNLTPIYKFMNFSLHSNFWIGYAILQLYPLSTFVNCFIRLRSSRPEMFCKEGVLKIITKLTGKHPC